MAATAPFQPADSARRCARRQLRIPAHTCTRHRCGHCACCARAA